MIKLELRSFLRTTYLLCYLSICYLFIIPWKTVITNHHPSLTFCPYDTYLNFKFRIVFRNNRKIYFNLPLSGPAILVWFVWCLPDQLLDQNTPFVKMILVFRTLDFYGRFRFIFVLTTLKITLLIVTFFSRTCNIHLKFTALVYQISIYHYRFLQSISYREFTHLVHGNLGRNKKIPYLPVHIQQFE